MKHAAQIAWNGLTKGQWVISLGLVIVGVNGLIPLGNASPWNMPLWAAALLTGVGGVWFYFSGGVRLERRRGRGANN